MSDWVSIVLLVSMAATFGWWLVGKLSNMERAIARLEIRLEFLGRRRRRNHGQESDRPAKESLPGVGAD